MYFAMCKLADGCADTFLNLDLAPGGSLHLGDDVSRDFQPFQPLLGNGVLDGPHILFDFLFTRHGQNLNYDIAHNLKKFR
jgi:hypothetical protein